MKSRKKVEMLMPAQARVVAHYDRDIEQFCFGIGWRESKKLHEWSGTVAKDRLDETIVEALNQLIPRLSNPGTVEIEFEEAELPTKIINDEYDWVAADAREKQKRTSRLVYPRQLLSALKRGLKPAGITLKAAAATKARAKLRELAEYSLTNEIRASRHIYFSRRSLG